MKNYNKFDALLKDLHNIFKVVKGSKNNIYNSDSSLLSYVIRVKNIKKNNKYNLLGNKLQLKLKNDWTGIYSDMAVDLNPKIKRQVGKYALHVNKIFHMKQCWLTDVGFIKQYLDNNHVITDITCSELSLAYKKHRQSLNELNELRLNLKTLGINISRVYYTEFDQKAGQSVNFIYDLNVFGDDIIKANIVANKINEKY